MDARAAEFRDTTLLSVAVVLGAVLAPQFALLGLPVAAAGIAGLAYRGRVPAAALSAAAGVAAVAVIRIADTLYVAPALVAVLMTVALMPSRNVQAVGAALIGLLTLASIGLDAAVARSQGTTLMASTAGQMQSIAGEVTKALGSSASAELVSGLKDAAQTMATAWPSAYFESSLVVGVLVIAAVAWAGRRAGRETQVPAFARLDLTPHVLWVFILGLVLLAASYGAFGVSKALGIAGLNLLLCSRALFFLQGISVSTGVLDRLGAGLGLRIFALAGLVALDALTLVISFIGLLDFWVNFRHLPRDGVTPEPSTQVDV